MVIELVVLLAWVYVGLLICYVYDCGGDFIMVGWDLLCCLLFNLGF